ncbi:hypothetical protein ACFSTA_18770 [Ornithinibacillus salinisoli]|uniref:Uncharacterized protein n=1 Tax=Ornithinibacillus salinisoli TaxID=1848459 RepID=A0ABW4W789_9BACI
MEIKIADKPVWKIIAIVAFVFAAVQFWGANNYYSSTYFFSAICFILLGISFLTRKNLTYLTLTNDILTIHLQGLGMLGKKKVKYSEIKKCEVLGKEVFLYLKNGRKYKLKNDWISYDDFSKLKKQLESYSIDIR